VTVASVGDVVGTARDSVGRYFSLVSALPSALLVFYGFALFESHGWSGAPDLRRTGNAVLHLGVGGSLALTGVSIAVAVALHPLQFAMVQLLEGYWGAGALAQRVRSLRMKHHSQRLNHLMDLMSDANDALYRRPPQEEDPDPGARLALISRIGEIGRLLQNQPLDPDHVMPTRLGMTLRHFEHSAGTPFGLDAIQVMPYLARVARPEDMTYVNDQRSQLDLAVRMTVTAMFACLLTIAALFRDGLWLLTALVPYLVAYLSYRGAVVAAGQYGRAVAVAIALNRFALYEQFRLPLPVTADNERHSAETLSAFMHFRPKVNTTYHHPKQ
jgi:hypothetical protein